MMGTIHLFREPNTGYPESYAMGAQANPFRGLVWGCIISSVLWLAVVAGGVSAYAWLTGSG